ncbi:hypothetical protein [Streptomyces sp. NPDC091268]|uniref:hypothetical protein n=1 Tax=Streptomyces sp. NPDC091268 TaxID=3365979 RepID=UPI0038007350
MAANHNSQAPEGDYDPAGSTQMFRAFVEEPEAAPVVPTVPGSRMQQRGQRKSASKTGLWVGVALALVVVAAAAAWLALG